MRTTSKKETTPSPKNNIEDRFVDIHDREETFSCLFYGRAGTGKTTILSSFPGPILILEAKEKGTQSIKHLLRGVAKVLDLTTWQDVEDAYWFLKKGKHPYKTVAWETLGSIQDLCRDHVLEEDGREKMTRPLWGEVSGLMKTWCLNYRDLPMYCVFNAHYRLIGKTTDEDDEVDDQIDPEVGPNVIPSVAKAVNGMVTVIGQTFIRQSTKQKDGKLIKRNEFRLRTGPHPYYITKIRSPLGFKVPGSIKNPTFEKLSQIVKGEFVTNGEEG